MHKPYALVNCVILNGTRDMKPKAGKAMVVRRGKIDAIINEGDLDREYPEIEKFDMQGGYVLPGLINLHVHLVTTGKAPKNDKPTDYKKLVQRLKKHILVRAYFTSQEGKNIRNQFMSGVTTVRSVGGINDWDKRARDELLEEGGVGTRIFLANTAISVPGGHFAGSLATESETVEEAVEDVRKIAETEPDLIKLMITGGVMDATAEGVPGALRMDLDMVKACCDEAHKLGLPVAAHVEGTEGLRVALKGGVDTIEHGATPDDEIMALFKERGAALVTTLSPVIPYALMPLEVSKCGEVAQKNGRVVMLGMIDCAKRCLEEGVPVGLGTDTGCPFITHYDMWREVLYFSLFCGVTPAFALHTATMVNATILGIQDYTGSLEVGKAADFIVTVGNPLDDLEELRNLRMVARDGLRVPNPRPNRDSAVDKALDDVLKMLR